MDLNELTDDIIVGRPVTPKEVLAVLRFLNAETPTLVAAAGWVRHHHLGTAIKVNYLINLRSDLCPEDCFYCFQHLGSQADTLKYQWLRNKGTVAAARAGIAGGAKWTCLVADGRGPSNRDVDKVAEIIGEIKAKHPGVGICVCLGQLKEGQLERLAATGADACNHDLDTAEPRCDSICATHSYQGHIETVQHVREHGLSICSDLITSMGESDGQPVEVAFALREINADPVPVNFLVPFDGTPLVGHADLSPQRYLHILAMVRFVRPDSEAWVATGRERHSRSLQPLSPEVYSSLFLGDYPTSRGQAGIKGLAMIVGYGSTVLGQEETSPEVDVRLVIRNQGVGTPEPADAQGHPRGRTQTRRLKNERMPFR